MHKIIAKRWPWNHSPPSPVSLQRAPRNSSQHPPPGPSDGARHQSTAVNSSTTRYLPESSSSSASFAPSSLSPSLTPSILNKPRTEPQPPSPPHRLSAS
ncbi:hypothetical protein CRG98_006241 [Punica granatum]|uniref:Uncharacterized protein n=1 Tax=Punica granatum TaxID=22663 RepID=A0A2I0KY70_PUNGR|nr:hypothetical protein CRG98_006241 [Punica granatum]